MSLSWCRGCKSLVGCSIWQRSLKAYSPSPQHSLMRNDQLENVTPKTSILLLHHGQPRTLYYAGEHLARAAHDFYKLPLWLTSYITRLSLPYAKKITFCVDDYKYLRQIPLLIDKYADILQNNLNQLVPEHAPFHCTYAFLFEERTIPLTVIELIRRGMQRLIVLPLYPFYHCFRTGTMLDEICKALYKHTIPYAKDGLLVENHRVRTMSHVSFQCSAIDRWSMHPVVTNFWYDMLLKGLKDHDSLLFVAPQMRGYNSSDYSREVWAFCQRLMDHLNQPVPWRLAWFGGWDQWFATTLENIHLQLYYLRRDHRERTLVIPITSLVPTFETESLLPMILESKGVDYISPPEYSPILAHGLAELIKNHLMGRRTSTDLCIRCRLCFSRQCMRRAEMFAPGFSSKEAIF